VTYESTLNVNAFSPDWRAYALANFPLAPFVLDDVVLASVEGFVQGIKFPPENPLRVRAFLSHSFEPKRFGEQAERVHVWWDGQVLEYGSSEHRTLIARGIRAKFFYNEGFRVAMLATRGIRLVHDLGAESPTTSLPAEVFCRILTQLREELVRTGTIAPP
jgi:hypothetical protein